MIFTEGIDPTVLERPHDVCIIGSGPAGLTLAVSLLRQGLSVLVLESGGETEDPALADFYKGEVSAPHAETTEYRRQRFGGTSHLWGGRCVPLDDHDLQARAHVPNSGWPLSANELRSHEAEAADLCDAGLPDFTVGSLRAPLGELFKSVGALAPDLAERVERYSLPTDFGKKYHDELSTNPRATVVLCARVVNFKADASGEQIQALYVRLSHDRTPIELPVLRVVLCTGGIEAARLMLVARRDIPSWSRLDPSLGKYYACHFDAIFANIHLKGLEPRFFFEKTIDGVYARRKLQFSYAFQEEHKLLNSSFRLHFPPYADPSHRSAVLSLIYLLKSILPREHQDILNHGRGISPDGRALVRHIINILTDPLSIGKFSIEWLFKIKLAKRKLPYTLINNGDSYTLEFNSEQIPSAGNIIELTDEVDADGMPRVRVKWQLTPQDVDSGMRSFLLFKELLANRCGVQVVFDEDQLRSSMQAALPVGGHHMGATRMSSTADDGVVDSNLKVHGVSNLWICSASVFPTNSHANPTFTLVTLAVRLAKHLASGIRA